MKAGKLVDLTKVLEKQHDAGRRLTNHILEATEAAVLPMGKAAEPLRENLHLFIRMYRPHAAREDTVLLPALHGIMTAKEYEAMGDRFEDREQELFGKNGFERIVGEVAELEKALGIEDLASLRRRPSPASASSGPVFTAGRVGMAHHASRRWAMPTLLGWHRR